MKRSRKSAKKSPGSSTRSRRTGQRSASLKRSPQTAAGDANIFAEIGFDVEEAENLRMRAVLMLELRRVIAGMTQRDAASLLRTTQPRISHLARGRIDLFTIDTIVNMLGHAGAKLRISVSRPRNPRAA